MTNRYEEQSEILAVLTKRVDESGRINALGEYRGRTARVLVLLRNPALDMPERRKVG
jgi:hypothetical protein